jgi:hypothetical protein
MAKKFKVLLKDKRELSITADSYDEDLRGAFVFKSDGTTVASFQITEVVGIVDEAAEDKPSLTFA